MFRTKLGTEDWLSGTLYYVLSMYRVKCWARGWVREVVPCIYDGAGDQVPRQAGNLSRWDVRGTLYTKNRL